MCFTRVLRENLELGMLCIGFSKKRKAETSEKGGKIDTERDALFEVPKFG